MNEKIDSILNDRKDMKNLKHKILNDISWKQNEKLEAKMQFMSANDDLMDKKNER